MAATPRWLRTFPPLRWTPGRTRPRRQRHTSLHHAYHEPVEAAIVGVGRAGSSFFQMMLIWCAWMLAAELWFAEIMLWCCVWIYYGLFYGMFVTYRAAARWIYRNNVVGKGVAAAQRRGHDTVDPRARPVDLGALAEQQPGADPWDTGQIRRRG